MKRYTSEDIERIYREFVSKFNYYERPNELGMDHRMKFFKHAFAGVNFDTIEYFNGNWHYWSKPNGKKFGEFETAVFLNNNDGRDFTAILNNENSHYEMDFKEQFFPRLAGYSFDGEFLYCFHIDSLTINMDRISKDDVIKYRKKNPGLSLKEALNNLSNIVFSDIVREQKITVLPDIDNSVIFVYLKEKGFKTFFEAMGRSFTSAGHVINQKLNDDLMTELKNFAVELDGRIYDKVPQESVVEQITNSDVVRQEKVPNANMADLQRYSSMNKGDDIDTVISGLVEMEKAGIELSQEQKSLISIYTRYKEFKENRDRRKQMQSESKEAIARLNSEKEAWLNNPNNPSNVRAMKNQVEREQFEALLRFRDVAPNMLSQEQRQFINYYEMMEKAQSRPHQIDTGMDPEIREWYRAEYGEEEEKGRAK